jgi:penicillin-binding protein 1A
MQLEARVRTLGEQTRRYALSSVAVARRLPFKKIAGIFARGMGSLTSVTGSLISVTPRLFSRPALAVLGGTFMLGAGYLVFCIATLPPNGGLIVEPTPSALLVESNDGRLFATRGIFKGARLSAGDLPPDLAKAVIAIEDRRFYEHNGIDLRGMFRAAWRNIASDKLQGGSTITQQLARMLYLSPERTIRRKVQEAILALWLERHLTKEEILVRYLNTAYFGAGVYGVDAAARRYFGKSARDLTLSESAMLAGLVRAPSALAPHRNLDAARERAETVLDAMVETGAVTQQQAAAARQQPTKLWIPPEAPPGTNYLVDTLTAETRRLVGAAVGDLRVATTLDLKLQALAETVINKRLAAEGARRKVGQAALIAMKPDGAIVAMVGGRDYTESQFNRATQAKRQPGSLFKLFVYLAAMQGGFTPQQVMVDQPIQVGDWEPENYGRRFQGAVTLRSAFARSINSVAVQLADEVGIKRVIEVAKRLGVQSDLVEVPSLALGSVEVTLMDMTRAFAAIAGNVESVEPYAVRAIHGKNEQSLYTRPAATGRPAADAAARRAMLELLASVVDEGTGRAARVSGTVFGKTGTTQEHRDAWFVGFTGDLVVGVWVGNDDNTPTQGVTGGSLPAGIWRDFVSQARPAGSEAPRTATQRPAPSTTGSASEATVRSAPLSPPPTQVIAEPSISSRRTIVHDTATLEIDGQVIRLAGVTGYDGDHSRRLARFLRRQEIRCERGGDQGYRCRVSNQDLAELILLNGGGRASEDATPELRAAEERARASRAGLWRR